MRYKFNIIHLLITAEGQISFLSKHHDKTKGQIHYFSNNINN